MNNDEIEQNTFNPLQVVEATVIDEPREILKINNLLGSHMKHEIMYFKISNGITNAEEGKMDSAAQTNLLNKEIYMQLYEATHLEDIVDLQESMAVLSEYCGTEFNKVHL